MSQRKPSDHSGEEESFQYATAYRYRMAERYTVGLDSFFASSNRSRGGMVAGEMVRLMCERGDEVRRSDDTIVINHNFPSTEGMTLRERIGNRVGKILVGFVGESKITTYTPIPDAELSEESLAHFRRENELFGSMHIRDVVEDPTAGRAEAIPLT